MMADILLIQTKEEAAKTIINAHMRQYNLRNQVQLYIKDGKFDFSNGDSPRGSEDVYKIWEWTLGETPDAMRSEGLTEEEVVDCLIGMALDSHGFDMVPDDLILPDGTTATIWYKGEY